jgi:fumarate reductase subunit C
VHMGKRRVPPAAIAGGNYAAALVASLLVAWLLLRG